LRKGNFIVVAQHEAIADIKLRIRPVKREGLGSIEEVCTVVYQDSQRIGYIVQAVCPGVVGIEGKPIPELPDGLELQSVVAGGPNALYLSHSVKAGIDQVIWRTECAAGFIAKRVQELSRTGILIGKTCCRSWSVRRCYQIDRHAYLQVVISGPDIGRFEN